MKTAIITASLLLASAASAQQPMSTGQQPMTTDQPMSEDQGMSTDQPMTDDHRMSTDQPMTNDQPMTTQMPPAPPPPMSPPRAMPAPAAPATPYRPVPTGATVDDASQSTGPRGVTQQGTVPDGRRTATPGEYPPCSRTVTDGCLQTYERGRQPG